jgi:hypothetical protein
LADAVPTATLEEAVFDMAESREAASLMTMPMTCSARRLSRSAASQEEVKVRERDW